MTSSFAERPLGRRVAEPVPGCPGSWCLLLILILAAPFFLDGCAAGLVGAILGIIELTDSDSESAPPVITQLEHESLNARSRILLKVRTEGEDQKRLEYRIEYTRLDAAPPASPQPATAAPGSLPDGEVLPPDWAAFIWNAKRDLGEESSSRVRITVTPIRDGVEGPPFHSNAFWAGNTPVRGTKAPELFNQGSRVEVIFDLLDREADTIHLVNAEISTGKAEDSVDGEDEFWPMPLGKVDRKDFASSPDGVNERFSFDVFALGYPDLAPGFKGPLRVRVTFRDFEGEREWTDTAIYPAELDLNDAPFVELLPFTPVDLSRGVVPIRPRVFDRERNPVRLEVSVDLQDGLGLRPALELPAHPSEGTDLCREPDAGRDCILPPESFGDPEAGYHTFLWDALSQPFGGDQVGFSVRADDRDRGAPTLLLQSGFQLVPFSRKAEVVVGDGTRNHAIGDFDGDGALDLVLPNNSTDKVSYLRGGEGGISSDRQREIPVGSYPESLAAGDFDGDEVLDLVVANRGERTVTFLKGRKGEGLSADRKEELSVPGYPVALAVGNFDGLETVDLVVACQDSGKGKLSFFPGKKGEGLSTERKDFEAIDPVALAAGDFDGDGLSDLVAADSGKVLYLAGEQGTGLSDSKRRELEPDQGETFPLQPFALGDFDGDGALDLVVAHEFSTVLSFFPGRKETGEGLSAEQRQVLDTGIVNGALMAGDFDGDGVEELAVADRDANRIAYLDRAGEGIFQLRRNDIVPGETPVSLARGDFDADGIADLAVANDKLRGTVTFLAGGADGLAPSRRREIAVGQNPATLIAGDFEGDGALDLAVVKSLKNFGIVSYLRGDPGGPSEEWMNDLEVGTFTDQRFLKALGRGDFNGDGALDLVVTDFAKSEVLMLGGGVNGPSARVPLGVPVGDLPWAVLPGRWNHDEFTDLVVANYGSATVSYLEAGANGLRPIERDIPTGEGPFALASGDFDADGELDLAVACTGSESGSVTWMRGSKEGLCGSGRAEPKPAIPLGKGPSAMIAGDFDGDGAWDVMVANKDSSSLSYLKGMPGEGLSRDSSRTILLELPPAVLATADFDGDGALDLAAAGSGLDKDGTVSYLGFGTAGGPRLDIAVGINPQAMATGDFDGDGTLDLVIANAGSSSVPDTGVLSYLRGGPVGSRMRKIEIPLGATPSALTAGDFDGDGALDLIVVNQGLNISYLRGGEDGLSPGRKRDLEVKSPAGEAVVGDFDGDGIPDLAVISNNFQAVSYLPSRSLSPRLNRLVKPEEVAVSDLSLLDPRKPSRFQVEIRQASLPAPKQIAVVPALAFEVPRIPGRYLKYVTEAVTLLPVKDGEFPGETWITLRLRTGDRVLLEAVRAHPEGLRVFHRGRKEVDLLVILPEIVNFEDGGEGSTGVRFPVPRLGSYLVAWEGER